MTSNIQSEDAEITGNNERERERERENVKTQTHSDIITKYR